MTTKLKDVEAISEYAYLCSFASSFTQGWIHGRSANGNPTVSVLRSSRGVDEDRPRASQEVLLCTNEGVMEKLTSVSLDVAKPTAMDISPTGGLTINLSSTFYGSTGNKEEKAMIEVISKNSESYRIDASNVHGAFMGDTWFGGTSWSGDEKYFAYVAVAKVEKPQTYFGSQSYAKSSDNSSWAATANSTKYNYTEDWGERFGGIGALGLFVLDVVGQRIHKIGNIDVAKWTVGQPCLFTAEDAENGGMRYLLGYTAFSNLPRKLGLFSCFQRPHSLFVTDITALLAASAADTSAVSLQHTLLSTGLRTARSLRCSPGSATLVFLGQEKGFEEHNGCSELFTVETKAVMTYLLGFGGTEGIQCRKVVAEVASVASVGDFPGLYCEALPPRCFGGDAQVVLASQWGSDTAMISVNLASGAVTRLSKESSTVTVLDVSGGRVLYAHSTPTQPVQLAIYCLQQEARLWSTRAPVQQAVRLLRATATGTIENKTPEESATGISLDSDGVKGLSWKVLQHESDGVPFESILIYPNAQHPKAAQMSAAGLPVILVPHGGPHSCMTTAYFHAYAFLAHQLCSAVLHVNYRGSPGYGQKSIHSLPGSIGKNDVADLMTALHSSLALGRHSSSGEAVLAADRDASAGQLLNAGRVSVVGGSHGGFLAGHMIGQYPEVFKAAAMRNPVTNIPAMYSVSDIPDWCVVESCGSGVYDFSTYAAASEEVLLAMRRGSPIHHVQNVRAPTLICLGGKDRRVPPSQGLEYHHILRAQGVETKLLVFPEDNHPIDKPASEAEHWVAIADWLAAHV